MTHKLLGAAIALLMLAACSDSNNSSNPVTEPEYSVDPATIDVSQADYCDITQQVKCLFPFPNDYFTVADPSTDTGRRVNFDERAIPLNVNQDPFDVSEHNRNDGFATGPMILAYAEGVDLEQSGAATLVDYERSLAPDAAIQVIDAETGERQSAWTELDAYPLPDQPRALMIRLARNLQDGRRYIVVMQNLVDAGGTPLQPSDAFKIYQEAIPSDIPELEARRAHFEELFASMESFGVDRDALFLAWDFTVSSTRSLSERSLHIRDTSLLQLAGSSPAVNNLVVTDFTPAEDPNLARIVEGTITVPNFMNTPKAGPGSRFNYSSDDPDALPSQYNDDGTVEAPFVCAIPHSAFVDAADGDTDTRAVVLGHGLFGNRSIVIDFGPMAEEQNILFCGMDWWGMSDQDVANAFLILSNLSKFPALVDRSQQAFLNKLLLSEAIVNTGGFASLSAFQDDAGNALLKAAEVHYDGVSQGAILGGALTALSPHFERSILNVAGMNWSLIIRRSNAWETYSIAYDPAYPDPLDQPLGLSLVQMLWDRGETSGYANHLTRDTLPGSKRARMLVHTAVGDQTLNETAGELLARTLGLPRHNPTVAEGRHVSLNPYAEIATIDSYPYAGDGYVVWDSGPFPTTEHDGTPLQRNDNLPQTEGYNTHGMPFEQKPARDQKALFWRTGTISNVCGGSACFGDGYDGTPGEYNSGG